MSSWLPFRFMMDLKTVYSPAKRWRISCTTRKESEPHQLAVSTIPLCVFHKAEKDHSGRDAG